MIKVYFLLFLCLIMAAAGLKVVPSAHAEDDVNSNSNIDVDTPLEKLEKKFVKSIFLAKAELKAIDGLQLTVVNKTTTYNVILSDKTTLRRKFGSRSNLAEFSVGDILQVFGRKVSDTEVLAKLIRNTSIQKKHGTFLGTIESVNIESKTFILKPVSRPLTTVIVNDATKIIERKSVKVFADLTVGMKVTAAGLWDMRKNTLAEVSKIVIVPKIEK